MFLKELPQISLKIDLSQFSYKLYDMVGIIPEYHKCLSFLTTLDDSPRVAAEH